eukprot:SAG25_NODE_791_length_5300_cov_1.525476_4_plen_133_part_00
MWVALDDVNRETGALSYLAGSHRQGLRPHDASHIKGFSQRISNFTAGEQRQMAEVAGLRPGDLVAHHGECIHSARCVRGCVRAPWASHLFEYDDMCGVSRDVCVVILCVVRDDTCDGAIAPPAQLRCIPREK